MATQLDPSGPPAGLLTMPGTISKFQRSLIERRAIRRSGDTLTVAQAMDQLMSAIEPNDAEREKASKQQLNVRAALEARLSVEDTYLSGSYRRHTQPRPLDDIDLLVVLDHTEHEITLDGIGTRKALDLLEAALRDAYPKTELVRHDRCIQIKFAGTGIGFDVVPVIRLTEHEFYIPDEARGVWVRTNPREVEYLVSEANKQCDGWLVPLVKLLKTWKDEVRAPLRGFHLEAMAYHQLKVAPVNEREGLALLFERLAMAVWSNCPDIWPMGENADVSLSWENRSKAAALLTNAAAEVKRAVAAEAEDRVDDAHAIWYRLMGDRYPETGMERASVSAMAVRDAVRTVVTGHPFSATSAGLIKTSVGFAGVRSASSHGGDPEVPEEAVMSSAPPEETQRVYLEASIADVLAQFSDLRRVDPAAAAVDPELWPMRQGPPLQPYAVLVGTQGTNYGTRHRILVKVPADMPATEPRVYLLRQHVEHRITGFGPRGVRSSGRALRHQWADRSMCSHSRRDRWDGRLVTAIVYAADWLFRQEHHRRFGRWIGHEIDVAGRHHLRGSRVTSKHRGGRNQGTW
jgi:hypothetical protein